MKDNGCCCCCGGTLIAPSEATSPILLGHDIWICWECYNQWQRIKKTHPNASWMSTKRHKDYFKFINRRDCVVRWLQGDDYEYYG